MKINNIIIIGGTIAAGKSILVEGLSKKFSWKAVLELKKSDKIQTIILKKLYEGKQIHQETILYYFLMNRLEQYKKASQNKTTTILDRSLWEDIIFAKLLFKNNKKSFTHYKIFWKSTIEDTIKKMGLPKAYIFLKIDWNTFKERIYIRNRSYEINNFDKNADYFLTLIKEYNKNFVNMLKKWNIHTIVIDAINLNKKEVLKKVINSLKKIDNFIN